MIAGFVSVRRDVFGWFDGPNAKDPAHDPGIESGICALCGKQLSPPVVTASILPDGLNRSYFYRTHKSCDLRATDDDRYEIDSMLVDMLLAPNGAISQPSVIQKFYQPGMDNSWTGDSDWDG